MVYRYLRMSLKKGKGEGKIKVIMRYIFAIINHSCHCAVSLRRMKQSLFPFKNIMGHVLAIMIVLLLFLPVAGFAESKEIISE